MPSHPHAGNGAQADSVVDICGNGELSAALDCVCVQVSECGWSVASKDSFVH